jgi:hypothetical protein
MERMCPFTGCDKSIPAEMFACRGHWFSLNADQKARVWKCYGEWKSGKIDGEELRRQQQVVLDETKLGGVA